MTRFKEGLLGFFLVVAIFAVPALAAAQNDFTSNPSQNNFTSSPSQNNFQSNPAQNDFTSCPSGATCLKNPISKFGTFCSLLKAIFNDLLLLGIPVATLFIVLAGFRLVTARGNEAQLTKAKTNLWYIVVGIALFLGAWTLSQIIANTLSALGGGGGVC